MPKVPYMMHNRVVRKAGRVKDATKDNFGCSKGKAAFAGLVPGSLLRVVGVV